AIDDLIAQDAGTGPSILDEQLLVVPRVSHDRERKMLYPPGPISAATTSSTIPRMICPWKSWTIPMIATTTARIHKMKAMRRRYPISFGRNHAAGASRCPGGAHDRSHQLVAG